MHKYRLVMGLLITILIFSCDQNESPKPGEAQIHTLELRGDQVTLYQTQIDTENRTITLAYDLPYGTEEVTVSDLSISRFASANIKAGDTLSVSDSPIDITITAEDGTSNTFRLILTVFSTSQKADILKLELEHNSITYPTKINGTDITLINDLPAEASSVTIKTLVISENATTERKEGDLIGNLENFSSTRLFEVVTADKIITKLYKLILTKKHLAKLLYLELESNTEAFSTIIKGTDIYFEKNLPAEDETLNIKKLELSENATSDKQAGDTLPIVNFPISFQITSEGARTPHTYTLHFETVYLQLTSSSPSEGARNVKLYHSFVLEFEEDIVLAADKTISLLPKDVEYPDPGYNVKVSTNDIAVNGKTLNFPALPARNTNVLIPRMLFQTETEMIIEEGVIVGRDSKKTTAKSVLSFTTQEIPSILVKIRNSNEFSTTLNWTSLTDFQLNELNQSYTIHKRSAATDDKLTGKDIDIAIVDTGIAKGSEIYPAVVFKSIDLDDEFLANFDDKWYNHGTQMGRHVLDYAPKTNLLDLDNLQSGYETLKGRKGLDLLSIIKDQDVDIVNLSGTGLDKTTEDDKRLVALVNDGLIVSVSMGNDSAIHTTPSSYDFKQLFLPYLYDFSDAKGAYVALQAALHSHGSYSTIRSRAGNTKHYAVTIIETGNGATSQAAASFSGIMALLLEANKKLSTGYTPRELVEIVMQTAVDIGEKGVDNLYGHGLVDIEAALNYIKTGKDPTFELYKNLDEGVAEQLQ